MQNEDWITIKGWMISEHKLKDAELMIYAVIYGFSRHSNGEYTGTTKYLQECSQSSRQTVYTKLKILTEKGLISRVDRIVCNINMPKYVAHRYPFDGSNFQPPEDPPKSPNNDDSGFLEKTEFESKTEVQKDESEGFSNLHPVKNLDFGVKNSDTDIYNNIYSNTKKAKNESLEISENPNPTLPEFVAEIDAGVFPAPAPLPPTSPPPQNSDQSPAVYFSIVFDEELVSDVFPGVTDAIRRNSFATMQSEIGKQNMKSLKAVMGETGLSGNHTLMLCYWLAYKRSKNQSYQQSGLRTLVKQMNKFDPYYIQEKLETAISANYTGLFFAGEAEKYEQWKKNRTPKEDACELLRDEYTDKINRYLEADKFDITRLDTKETGIMAMHHWSIQGKVAAAIWNFRLAYNQNSKVRFLAKEDPGLFTFAVIKRLMMDESKFPETDRALGVWSFLLDVQFENRDSELKKYGLQAYIIQRLINRG